MQHNLVGVLRELKPRRALFTTYTFNPAFFEATILQAAFRPDGCQIHVLVDDGPLAASAIGSYAQHIGSRYAVAPVRAPGGGIFHPKIALLENDDRQVLCVGSGNLTASGLAHQLECLDITDLAAEPVVAGQLRSFLRALAERCGSTSPRAADMLVSAADSVRGEEPPSDRLRRGATLIHTLERTAAVQMEELLRRDGQRARVLTVLAPFHSKDGAAVRALRQAVDAPELHIAHLGTVACNAQAYGDAASYVVPRDHRKGPPLHAKVFEFETDDGALVVSGSVNATRQSLQSTQNVEVSLARWTTVSPFEWQPCEPDQFVPQVQVFEPRRVWTMEAVLLGSSRLEALVLGQGATQAQVDWVLARASGEVERGCATLDAKGLLRMDLSAPVGAAHEGLTLHVRGSSGIEARAWVNDQRALRAVRNGVRLGGRAPGGEPAASDYRFATELILRALGGQPIHGPVRTGARQPEAAQAQGEALDEAFNYEDWLRSGRLRTAPGATLGRRAGAFLARVLDLLFPHPGSGSENESGDAEANGIALDDANPADEDGERRQGQMPSPPRPQPARTPQAEAERAQLLKACQAVREAFEEGREGIGSADLLVLAVCSLDMERAQQQFLMHAAGEPSAFDGHRVLLLWLDCVSRYDFATEIREDLLPVACAVAAAAAAIPPRADPLERHLSQLRDAVCRLAARPLAHDEVQELVARGMREELMLRMDRRFRAAAMASTADVAQAEPLDGLLLRAIGLPADPLVPASMAPMLSALDRWSDRSRGFEVLRPAQVRAGGCPICYLQFNRTERRDLAYRRWMLHGKERQHVLLYPDDVDRFRQTSERTKP